MVAELQYNWKIPYMYIETRIRDVSSQIICKLPKHKILIIKNKQWIRSKFLHTYVGIRTIKYCIVTISSV